MSRRTKLCITALFLVLLAVPATYVALTWHPPNPLRFRHVGERFVKDPLGHAHNHYVKMELRNTSDTTVMLLFASLRGFAEPEEDIATTSRGGRPVDTYTIPPHGVIEVEFNGEWELSEDVISKLQAGEWQARRGTVKYGWLSPPKVRLEKASAWLSEKLPVSWLDLLPQVSPFIDTIEVDSTGHLSPASSAETHPDPSSRE